MYTSFQQQQHYYSQCTGKPCCVHPNICYSYGIDNMKQLLIYIHGKKY